MDRSFTSIKNPDINKEQNIKRPKPTIVKSECQKRVNNIKNKANVLIKYQNEVIKEQSDQMMTMVSLLENAKKNSVSIDKNASECKLRENKYKQEIEKINNNNSYYLKVQMALFIVMILLMILLFMSK